MAPVTKSEGQQSIQCLLKTGKHAPIQVAGASALVASHETAPEDTCRRAVTTLPTECAVVMRKEKSSRLFRTPKSVLLAATRNRVFIMKKPKGDGTQA